MAYREVVGRDSRDACRKPSTTVSDERVKLDLYCNSLLRVLF